MRLVAGGGIFCHYSLRVEYIFTFLVVSIARDMVRTPQTCASVLPCILLLQDLAIMFVDERVIRGRWEDEDEASEQADELPYTPPAFMQLLDSIAQRCPVSAILTLQHRLGRIASANCSATRVQRQVRKRVACCAAGTSGAS